MKKLLLLLLLPVFIHAQEKKTMRPYFDLNIGMYKFKNADARAQGSFSAGAHMKDVGIGIGFAITKFAGDQGNYVPVFFEINLMPATKKVSPYGNIRLGTAAYNEGVSPNITKGGFYGAIQFGAAFPVAKSAKLIAGIGYVHPTFSTDIKAGARVTTTRTSLDGFSAFFGFLL